MGNPIELGQRLASLPFAETLEGKFAHMITAKSPVAQEMAEMIRSCPALERTAGGYFPNNTDAIVKPKSFIGRIRHFFSGNKKLDKMQNEVSEVYKKTCDDISKIPQDKLIDIRKKYGDEIVSISVKRTGTFTNRDPNEHTITIKLKDGSIREEYFDKITKKK